MGIPKELLEIIVCPVTRKPLKEADPALAERLRAQLKSGKLSMPSDADWALDEISGFLVTEDGRRAYPVIGAIPQLLPTSGVEVE